MSRDAIVIAGAGIAGIATAWHLAQRIDGSRILVVDARPPLTLTSDRPEANYRNWWPQPAMVALANRSIDLIEDLQARPPGFMLNRRGYLYVTADPALAARLPEIVSEYREAGLGLDATELILEPSILRARYPHLSPSICGAIHAKRAGSVDTVGLGQAMLREALERGVRVIAGALVEIERGVAGISAVRIASPTRDTRLETDQLLDAAGPFAADVARLAGIELPVETVLRQKVLLHDPLGVLPRTAPFTIGLDALDGRPPGVHIKPDDSAAGDAIKLGWAVDQATTPPVVDPACPPEFPRAVLARAATIVPGLSAYLERELDVIDHDGGFYARTPDGMPLIGPLGMRGGFVLAGLAGFGAMMACAAGNLAAGWILGDEPTELASAFHPARLGGEAQVQAARPGEL